MTESTFLQLRTLIRKAKNGDGGELELKLERLPRPTPGANDVLLRVDAAPLNPSDHGLLFGAADMSTAKYSGTKAEPIVTAEVPAAAMKAMAGRLGQSLPAGNEGAGVVVEAGDSPAAQALLGKTVAACPGEMYGQYRVVPAHGCLPLGEGATAAQGASSFVNPLTALGMVETLKREGHKALVHTAAASALGQMLQRICTKDGIPLVNVVRKPEQAALLREVGAKHIVDSTSPSFADDLTAAIAETGATLGFDATGGGTLASQILSSMEAVLARDLKVYSRYGSSTHKQVYIYGGLDTSPLVLTRNFGLSWGLGGWLVFNFWQKAGEHAAKAARERIARELTTTFATSYSKEISLAEALSPEAIASYAKRATGEKYLILPNR